MTRSLMSTGSPFEAEIRYSRAVVQDGWVFVSGTTGYDCATMSMPTDVAEQCRNALKTIAQALAEAGAGTNGVVCVRHILPDGGDFRACWPVLQEVFGGVRPAATMISSQLMEPQMKIEIEVTARLPGN